MVILFFLLLELLNPLFALETKQLDCSSLWTHGVPSRPGSFPCVEYIFQDAHPNVRIFRHKGATELPGEVFRVLRQAQIGLSKAHTTYAKYGNIQDLYLIYIAGPNGAWAETYAQSVAKNAPCPILTYEKVQQKSNPSLRELFAHEAFHCFQSNNYWSQAAQYKKGAEWWMEGTADMMADLVFPIADEEMWAAREYRPDKPLFEQSTHYKTSLYFMSLKSIYTYPQILKKIEAYTPTYGDMSTQISSWSYDYRSSTDFHHFAKLFYDQKITDAIGQIVKNKKIITVPIDVDDTLTSFSSYYRPYTVNVSSFKFRPDRVFKISPEFDDVTSSILSYREMGTAHWNLHWGIYPGSNDPIIIDTTCSENEKALELLYTTAGSNLEKKTIKFGLHSEERLCKCNDTLPPDPCLEGSWNLDINEFIKAYLELMNHPENLTVEMVGGSLLFQFKERMLKIIPNQFFIKVLIDSFDNIPQTVTDMTFKGQGQNQVAYPADKEICLHSGTGNLALQIDITGPGENHTTIPIDMSAPMNVKYQCSPSRLDLTFKHLGLSKAMTLIFNKVDLDT